MVTQCRTVTGEHGVIYPPVVDRKAPGEIVIVFHDLAADVDCAGTGVSILSATWAIRTEDDDGTLTLSGESITGLIAQVTVTGGTAGSSYVLITTIDTSDGQRLERSLQLPVVETLKVAA